MDERVSEEQAGLPTKDISKFLCEFDTVRQGYHFINRFSSPLKVGQLELVEKESTPEKPKQMGNREKMRRKEENWEVINNSIEVISTTIQIIITAMEIEKMRRSKQ